MVNDQNDRFKLDTSHIAYMGLCLALALILSYVETLIPFDFGIPGIKIGLANLCVVVLLYICGFKEAITVNLLRIILAGFMFGNLSMIIYSLAGAVCSFLCMLAVYKTGRFSPMGVSLAGGVAHNAGQLIVAAFVLGTARIMYYAPALIISGALTGALLGFVAELILPLIKRR